MGISKEITLLFDCIILYQTVLYVCRLLLQGSDLSLAHGRRYGFVGRNGLGKTTLLRMISS